MENNNINNSSNNNSSNKKNKNTLMWVLLGLVIVLAFFMPKIYGFFNKMTLPKVEKTETKTEEENKTIDDELLESLHYPVMRNSIYNKDTYYSKDKFKVSDMSNSDILYTAFLDIYEGNMTSSGFTGSCTNVSKQFSTDYLELRVKNILGRNIKYNLENFNVPIDSSSNYKGSWTYDSSNSRYVYQGLCNNVTPNTSYHNIEQFIKAEYDKDDIIVYYYVGFAKVEGSNYIIYSDAQMTKEINSGTINNVDELQDIFKSLSNSDKKIYKYTFKDTLCTYNDYCLYQGEYIDKL